jgi:D-alanyl-D-alanine carboxypeptidase
VRRCASSAAVFSFALLALVAPTVTRAANLPSISSPAVQSAVVAAVQRDRVRFGGHSPIPATIIGVWDDKGHSFIKTFGYENLATKAPLKLADHFRIGSNTKTFVVSVLLQLVTEGKLALDDPLSHFQLGVSVPNARNITIRELCDMRSGLFEAFDTPQFAALNGRVPKNFNQRMLVAWAVRHKPYFAPNQGYRYSNTNYILLGLIIQAITNDSVANEIRKRLIEPFGLTQTSFPQVDTMPDPWARGYGLGKNANWQDVSNTVPVAFTWSAGAMISAAADIRRWIKLYATGQASGRATYRDLIDCIPFLGNTSFGLGITCSAGWYGYTGALPGYNTADYYSPSTGVTILAWIDYQAAQPVEGVASVMVRDIARVVTPGHVPFVYTPEQLRKMTGGN